MRKINCVFALMLTGATSAPALASSIQPAKPLTGYKCLAIDAPESVMMNFQHPIPMKDEPNDAAAAFAPAGVILAVKDSPELQNGYVKSMNLAFRPGWVPTQWVKPYSEVHPGVKCAPYVMNNGKLGFVFTH